LFSEKHPVSVSRVTRPQQVLSENDGVIGYAFALPDRCLDAPERHI
jgi:hypothetical protein